MASTLPTYQSGIHLYTIIDSETPPTTDDYVIYNPHIQESELETEHYAETFLDDDTIMLEIHQERNLKSSRMKRPRALTFKEQSELLMNALSHLEGFDIAIPTKNVFRNRNLQYFNTQNESSQPILVENIDKELIPEPNTKNILLDQQQIEISDSDLELTSKNMSSYLLGPQWKNSSTLTDHTESQQQNQYSVAPMALEPMIDYRRTQFIQPHIAFPTINTVEKETVSINPLLGASVPRQTKRSQFSIPRVVPPVFEPSNTKKAYKAGLVDKAVIKHFKSRIAELLHHQLSKYFTRGRIQTKQDFKFLCQRFSDILIDKEIRYQCKVQRTIRRKQLKKKSLSLLHQGRITTRHIARACRRPWKLKKISLRMSQNAARRASNAIREFFRKFPGVFSETLYRQTIQRRIAAVAPTKSQGTVFVETHVGFQSAG